MEVITQWSKCQDSELGGREQEVGSKRRFWWASGGLGVWGLRVHDLGDRALWVRPGGSGHVSGRLGGRQHGRMSGVAQTRRMRSPK